MGTSNESSRFIATGNGGRRVMVIIHTEHPHKGKPVKEYRTADGEQVERIETGKFWVVDTGEILVSD